MNVYIIMGVALVAGMIFALLFVGLVEWLSSPKRWRIGKHEVARKEKTLRHEYGYGMHETRSYYRCHKCHRTAPKRGDFKSKKCWAVANGK